MENIYTKLYVNIFMYCIVSCFRVFSCGKDKGAVQRFVDCIWQAHSANTCFLSCAVHSLLPLQLQTGQYSPHILGPVNFGFCILLAVWVSATRCTGTGKFPNSYILDKDKIDNLRMILNSILEKRSHIWEK